MLHSYVYMLFVLFLLWIWFVIRYLRKDLRRILWKTSVMWGLTGLIAEFWYFKDYRHPPSVLWHAVVSFEDFLFGFCITGISASLYDLLFTADRISYPRSYRYLIGVFFVAGVVMMLVFNNLLGFNSIFVSSFAFLLFAVLMICLRKDLLIPSLSSGILVVLLIIPIYMFFFNYIAPDYRNAYGLMTYHKFGNTVLGNIPFTELLWYFTWACFAGIAYDFASGKQKVTKSSSSMRFKP